MKKAYNKNMSRYTWLIDAGHGGINEKGEYVTAPKKMFDHGDFKVYEGETNRKIAEKLMKKLDDACIDYVKIHEDVNDTSLHNRVVKADTLHSMYKNCVYLSIHSNAGGGRGIEVFTSKGQTKSDKIAQVFFDVFENAGKWKMRKDATDGDDDKESNFYVLRKTDCPALLVELLFFDNKEEALYLNSSSGQEEMASLLMKGIQSIEDFIKIP